MINFDHIVKEKIKEDNSNRPQIPDHLYRIFIFVGSGSGKTNSVFDIINHQPDMINLFIC